MERAAERHRDRRVAVPAQLDDGGLVAREAERGRETGAAGAGMEDEIAFGWRLVGQREPQAERFGDAGARRIDVDQRDLGGGERAAEEAGQRADHARADDGDLAERRRRRHPTRR